MKKSILLGLVAALFMGQSAMAQSAQEISYVEDPAQGYLFNSFSNNWFVSAEGGINYYFDRDNSERKFMDRFSPNAGIWVGKWFSPIVGLRVGGNFTSVKGLGKDGGVGYYGTYKDWDKYKRNEFGIQFNAMVNLTNWWCGYRPGRVYNAIVYGGAGYNWVYTPKFKGEKRDGWEHNDLANDAISVHAGLINNFNLNKNVALYLDLRLVALTDDWCECMPNKTYLDGQAYIGITYNFNKSTWSAPIVPVIPEIPNCDEVEARLQAANGRIADLEAQLRDCLNRPVQTIVQKEEGPLCTIYYTIGSSRISRVDSKVLGAVAEVMKSNPDQKYTVCGWADNYTGTDAINDRLRHARANGVEKVLLRNGVNPSQLDVTVNNANLNDMGEKFVSLDRAVTIKAN
ncbi:MAG: OmpA family protein [Muribaculaceae bacterium]|nr:OmpA family protein [Muribaculaceae bacterium]